MTCGRNAAGSRFESADAAEMRGHSNGAAAVAANAACRAAGSDGCGFAAARAAGGVSHVPRIAGSASEKSVGFVSHQEFGSVCVSEEDGSSGFQSSDERGIPLRQVFFAQKRAGGSGPAGDVDTAFDGERDAVEWPDWISAQNGGLLEEGLDAGVVRVQMEEGIEFRLARFDALEMGVDDFDGRELLRTNACGNFPDCGEGGGEHGAMRESMRVTGEGQAENKERE